MTEVASLLENVVVDDSLAAATRRHVLSSYLTFQAEDRVHELYERVYQHLFDALPEAKRLFANTDMVRQYNALHQALKILLDYDPDSEAGKDAIGAVAITHRQHGLGDRHVDAFERALMDGLQSCGVCEPETLEAWRKILAPGLDHMRRALRELDPVSTAPGTPRDSVARRATGDDGARDVDPLSKNESLIASG